MSQAVIRKVASKFVKPSFTDVRSGDRVRVYTTVKEGSKERTQYFEGLVIRRRGGIGPEASFTVRRIAAGAGVERVFPLHSPKVTKIEIQRAAKVRRAQLHYMRDRAGKAARMKELPVKQADRTVAHPWLAVEKPAKPEKVSKAPTQVKKTDDSSKASKVADATPKPAKTEAPDGK